jgi:hypothetical protein
MSVLCNGWYCGYRSVAGTELRKILLLVVVLRLPSEGNARADLVKEGSTSTSRQDIL